MQGYQFIGVILWIATGLVRLSFAQEPANDVYAGLSEPAAKAKFESAIVDLRRQQRAALQAAREQLEQLLTNKQLDADARTTLENVATQLSPSSDFLMTLELVLQSRGKLSGAARSTYDEVANRLSQHWLDYQQCKRDYQRVSGRSLAKRWLNLDLESKRCELADYYALADQRPPWLMRGSPINIVELVPRSALLPINQYLAEKHDLIQVAQTRLAPALTATLRIARAAADDSGLMAEQREAARDILRVLEAPYGRELRGVSLCQPKSTLPPDLRAAVHSLLKEYLQRIREITPAHDQLLRDLATRLEPNTIDRLQNLKFDEQMPIELHLAQITPLIQPTRVLASRSWRTNHFENAHLIDMRESADGFIYRALFLIDGVTQWVNAEQITISERDTTSSRMRSTVPADGPGKVVTDLTNFDSGQVFAHGPAGWKPVTVVEESPLGVFIRWHGAADPVEFHFPREHLRIVATQPEN